MTANDVRETERQGRAALLPRVVPRVLIVDDEPSICWGFREFLTDEGYDVNVASSAEEAFRITAKVRPDVVFLDVRLPGVDGLAAMPRLREQIGDTPIIVITAFGNLETAVRALAGGAFDYLWKPFDLDQASAVLQRALESAAGRKAEPSETAAAAVATPGELVGSSPVMQRVFKQIALVASSDVPVLITGESGTGKELVARAIHRHSRRCDGPFLPVCLAALSPTLVESELFGHVRGAFTGSTHDRQGLLELAAGGTVLLDEIGDTTPVLQVKLLRMLEQREIAPVGDARPRPIDVRIVAATNRLLPELIRAGQFREDLFFRLGVFQIELPPLRERAEDVLLLAEHFLARVRAPGATLHLSEAAKAELCRRSWPGNVRELRNALEHASILARGGIIGREHLPPVTARVAVEPETLEQKVRQQIAEWAATRALAAGSNATPDLHEQFLQLTEPPLLRALLEHCENNRAAAAEMLGLHRATLRQKLRRYGLG